MANDNRRTPGGRSPRRIGLLEAERQFLANVVWNLQLWPGQRLEAARIYLRLWGDRALIEALDHAEILFELPAELAAARHRLTARTGRRAA